MFNPSLNKPKDILMNMGLTQLFNRKYARLLVKITLCIIVLLLFKPMVIIAPDEEGLILYLGRHIRTISSGFHLKAPWPFETVIRSPIRKLLQLEVGFRTIDQGPPARYQDYSNDKAMLREAQMLSGDENIVNVDMAVQWKIISSREFFFNYKAPEKILRDIAECALRTVIGDHSIDTALTTGKDQIQAEAKSIMQDLADKYHMGIRINQILLGEVQPPVAVSQAFKDVATAKEDKARLINEAKGYSNERIPVARGEAEKILRESEGYAASRIAIAEGEAQRFNAIALEYSKAPDVTRSRLYFETMQEVMTKVQKLIVDAKVSLVNVSDIAKQEASK
jgi:modulator of FtsH protease HflK